MNMKKFVLLSVFMIAFAMGSMAQVRAIDNPDYLFKNTGLETITKIEWCDTVTKVHVHVTFLPNWWVYYDTLSYIQPVGSGERFHLLRVENVELGEHLSTPSGEADYVLHFPALDESVKKIHYGNIEGNRAITVIGSISLERSFDSLRYEKSREIPAHIMERLEEEAGKMPDREPTDFDSDVFFDNAPARLIGFIRGYRSDEPDSKSIITPRLNGKTQFATLHINPDGYFEAEIQLEYPKVLSFRLLKGGEMSFYIEPGQTVTMILDWEDVLNGDRYRNRHYVFANTTFEGKLAEVNRDLLRRNIVSPGLYDMENQIKSLSPVEFLRKVENRLADNLDALRMTNEEQPLCDKAFRLIENEIKADAISDLMMFSWRYMHRESENEEEPIESGYYKLMEVLPNNDRSLLAVKSFDELIASINNAGIFYRPGNMYRPNYIPEQTFPEFIMDEGKELTEETIDILLLVQKSFFPLYVESEEELRREVQEHKEKIQQVLNSYINEWIDYLKLYAQKDPLGDYRFTMEKRSEIMIDVMHLEGILKDASLFYFVNHRIFGVENLSSDEQEVLITDFKNRLSNPFMKEYPVKMR